ncbi:cation diffusion facilitator family transporter [Tropicimonas marinistellae]|uniref:cation diffusion facilitator family transporter n=1 Tax=Tropicimonas marinistellae TaxID=1739787 RepID=UPI00082DB699|nr:cation diffusion facilitator family transporter [Tropicimonas marinistellae]
MTDRNTRLNISAAIASACVAAVLVGIKLWALGHTGALTIAASLADSAIDLMMSFAGLAAIVYASRPPDEDHGFGHSSAEDLAALGQALFLLGAAVVIGVAGARRLLTPEPPALADEGAGIAVMIVSIILTGALIAWQRYVAARTKNRVIEGASLQYIGDLIPNIGAICSLWASASFGLTSVDSAVAIATAGILVAGAFGIGRSAWHALMDREADPDTVAEIAAMARDWPGINGFHDLRTRSSGQRLFVNIHVEIDGRLPLTAAHDIGAGLRHAILEAFPQADVIIHHDPVRDPAELTPQGQVRDL